MQTHLQKLIQRAGQEPKSRAGSIIVLCVFVIVMVLAFAAFTVDVGYIALAKTELQNATDSAALAGASELRNGFGLGSVLTPEQVSALANASAQDYASRNAVADETAAYCSPARDCRVGKLVWNEETGAWTKQWNATPYNLFEVTLHRDQHASANGDAELSLFFAPVIGHDYAGVTSTATAALIPGGGFRVKEGSGMHAGVLPITLDLPTWNDVIAGIGPDDWSYNTTTGAITPGPDGIEEVNLYPHGTTLLPPGNRGTVDIGHSGNSSSDIKRQILYGLNEDDLAHYGGEFRFDDVPMILNGDTGLSAGIKAQLEAIKGQPRAIPIFTAVSGPGNNANYTIVKFVGVRILDVQLTGSPSNKHVTIQPAPFSDGSVIPSKKTVEVDSILSPVSLIP